jgi:hypothetical protein
MYGRGSRDRLTDSTNPRERRKAAREIEQDADLLLDGITVALQEFDTNTLVAIAECRDRIHKDGWMQRLIREYVEIWR